MILINFVNKYDFEFKLKTTGLTELTATEATVQCRIGSGETRRGLCVSFPNCTSCVRSTNSWHYDGMIWSVVFGC